MKQSFCLTVFALCLCLAMEAALTGAAPSPADAQMSLKRVVRQMPPPPPPSDMPPPPPMPPMALAMAEDLSGMYQSIAGIPGATWRTRREAKGGGAMPTRKG